MYCTSCFWPLRCDEGSWVPDVVLAGCESDQTRGRMPDRDRFDYRRLRHRVQRGRACDCSCHQRGDNSESRQRQRSAAGRVRMERSRLCL